MKGYAQKIAIATVVVVIITGCFFMVKGVWRSKKESIDVNDIVITSPNSNHAIKIGVSPKVVVSALGKPKQISTFSAQTNYKQGTVLNYNGAKFYFVHNKLSDFEITSHKYKVGLKSINKFNTIGNSTADLNEFKIEQNTALLNIKDSDGATDEFLEYDLGDNGQITKISYSNF